MTLPFNIPDKHKRKYTCFVCGMQFDNFAEYKEHIIEEHEEGRDYVICPIKHCGAPVRDLRAHFKVKHRGMKLPQVPMTRASIWRDYNHKTGKMKTRKPKFREGWYESTKMNKKLHYRSGYELTIYECLDQDMEVEQFNEEPFEIPYVHEGKAHNYRPDLIIKFNDGTTEVWEIKPSNQTTLQKNKDKWYYANQACDTRGWKFKVITEKGIELLKKKVKNQLNG